jgi:hypothetical protein
LDVVDTYPKIKMNSQNKSDYSTSETEILKENIITIDDLLSKLSNQKLINKNDIVINKNDIVAENIKNITEICNKKYFDYNYYGNTALNRKISGIYYS